eukprot:TRINITY_DN40459_c0_g1_i1.p1 TRINITY_DN40459_c0_g1~~TRINITY_DN40459_c0_g1_i1.p1  ORF type:complete len:187 (+),score=12.99 TRINITY_DN40459_c0_g1_i1:199-759(+)
MNRFGTIYRSLHGNSRAPMSRILHFGKIYENFHHHHQHQLQIFRNLILQTDVSKSVKLEKLDDSDTGIVKVELDRPEVKNAIGKDMLKRLQDTLKSISEDSKANVVMICSSVPKVFCAGADLKVADLLILFLAAIDENMLLFMSRLVNSLYECLYKIRCMPYRPKLGHHDSRSRILGSFKQFGIFI